MTPLAGPPGASGFDDSQLEALRAWLDPIAARYENESFISDDPVSVVHAFDDPQDQEIAGLFAALLAWGRRDTLLKKLAGLMERMDFRPARFIHDLEPSSTSLEGFRHRTFSSDDALGLSLALQLVLRKFGSLEGAFANQWSRAALPAHLNGTDSRLAAALTGFSNTLLMSVPGRPARMRKHIARPTSGSACKRLVMYLRWMVRRGPVDLGLWNTLGPEHLALPLDVHSGRQARAAHLLTRQTNDWRAVMELTCVCRKLRPHDPAFYDFAFFGTGSAGELLGVPRSADETLKAAPLT